MNNITLKDNNGVNWRRVTKQTAKKEFDKGSKIVFCACKLNPFGFWNPGVEIQKNINTGDDFQIVLNSFEFYNCNNETGLYTAFYITDATI